MVVGDRERWPDVRNHTSGNEYLPSTAKALSLLGYEPFRGGRHPHGPLVCAAGSGERRDVSRARAAPVLVGALGGSGTRVVARLLRHAGVFMGSELNEAEDSKPVMRFYGVWLRRYLENDGDLAPSEWEAATDMLGQAVGRHLEELDDVTAGWGVKVPRNILMLAFWHRLFPKLSFVHLVRNGLDMAYSKDRNQLRMVGDQVLTIEERRYPEPLRAIAYWQRVNLMAADYGESRLGPRYLRLRFEDVCAHPTWAYEQLSGISGARGVPALPDVVEKEVDPPRSIGRWRTRPSQEIRELEQVGAVGLRRFGYGDPE